MSMPENVLEQIFAACHQDEALKARFKANPRQVLEEWGLTPPEDMEIKVLEDNSTQLNITLPLKPTESIEVDDDELLMVAGGGYVTLTGCSNGCNIGGGGGGGGGGSSGITAMPYPDPNIRGNF